MSRSVYAYATGLFCCSICAPDDMTGEQAAAAFQEGSPAGTERGWQLSEDPHFKGGQPQGCDCDMLPGRRHWLVDC